MKADVMRKKIRKNPSGMFIADVSQMMVVNPVCF